MKYAFALLLTLGFFSGAMAENRYVIDELLVPLRSSPCGRCNIIDGAIKSGTVLTFLKETRPEGEAQDWSQVTTPDGLTGWLPSQYLTNQQVAKVRIKTLQNRYGELEQRNLELEQQIAGIEEEKNVLQNQLDELSSSNTSVNRELAEIKQVSGEAIAIQRQNQELLKRNKMLQSEVDVLTASNEQLKSKDNQTWFLYGGLLVVIGALLAVVLPRLRPRKKFSEWG